MSTNQGEDLRKFLLVNEIAPETVALKIKKAKGTIYNWFKKAKLTHEQINLLKDNGYDFLNKSSNGISYKVQDFEQKYKIDNITHVPLYAYGGFMRGYANKVYLESLEKYSLPGITGEHFSFEAQGMSMYLKEDNRSISPGDWVIGRPEETLEAMTKGKIYILVTVEGICVKIFDKINAGRAYFHSLNLDYPGEVMILKEIKKVFFVVKILKNPYS
jgi:hypothetical protein